MRALFDFVVRFCRHFPVSMYALLQTLSLLPPNGSAALTQVQLDGDMLGTMLRSMRPQTGALTVRICRHPALRACRAVSSAVASATSAPVQHRPAMQEGLQHLRADTPQASSADVDALLAVRSQQGLPSAEPQQPSVEASHPAARREDPRAANGTFIRSLRIRDFALVEDQAIRLAPGLNVITGESGAGKSVLVEAFASILGSPAPEDCVRPPAESAVVEGTVQLSPSALVRFHAWCGVSVVG